MNMKPFSLRVGGLVKKKQQPINKVINNRNHCYINRLVENFPIFCFISVPFYIYYSDHINISIDRRN